MVKKEGGIVIGKMLLIVAIYMIINGEYTLFLTIIIVYLIYVRVKPEKQVRNTPKVEYIQTVPQITVHDEIPSAPETISISTESWGKEPSGTWYSLGSNVIEMIKNIFKPLIKLGD